jgi:N-acetylmuramoyl-L-alanine amidase
VSPATLRSANKLSNDELKVGQHLTIPGTELAAKE